MPEFQSCALVHVNTNNIQEHKLLEWFWVISNLLHVTVLLHYVYNSNEHKLRIQIRGHEVHAPRDPQEWDGKVAGMQIHVMVSVATTSQATVAHNGSISNM